MTTHVDRVASATLQLTVLISSILSVGTLMVVALAVNPAAAGLIAAAAFGLSLLLRPVAAAARRIGALQSAAGRTFASAVTETVAVAREARVFGVADRLLDRVMRESATQAGLYQRSRALLQIAGPLYQSVAMLALIGALALVATGEGIVLADLGAIVLLLLRAFSYGQQAQSALHSLNDFSPYLEDVAAKEHQYHAAAVTPGERRVERIGRVELDAVSFNYTGAPQVLRDVSVVFGPGETVGVIGPSGSGKSTLLQLLLRLREPVRGELRVDGQPATEVSLESWYERVAFVPQEGRLLRGTVAENITFLRPGDDRLVERAARLAHVHDEIVAMPDGYGTLLAPGTLSGGQIQRICIARALFTDPDLLLLDEPTSALDALSEQRIRETLESLHSDHTIVIVAHRITTLSMCDRILVLEQGEVAALGDHDSLLGRSAFYEEAIRLSTLPQ
jgi:ABC-type multidrug transport system fused ATPase/permease subunit